MWKCREREEDLKADKWFYIKSGKIVAKGYKWLLNGVSVN